MPALNADHCYNDGTHRNHYVAGDWGTGYMFMRNESFYAATAALFSTFKSLDLESSYHWYQIAGEEGMIFG